jgi:prepilin-type N-terminal cleavage/methylation domain-containing protein
MNKMKTDTNMIAGFIPPKAGFTLVEVVIAMALLILSLAAFTVSFVQSRRSAAISDNRLDAIHTARDKMEVICSYLYSSTGLSIGTHNFTNGFYTVSNNTSARVKDIVVTLRWINPPGKITSTVSLASSVSSNLHQ